MLILYSDVIVANCNVLWVLRNTDGANVSDRHTTETRTCHKISALGLGPKCKNDLCTQVSRCDNSQAVGILDAQEIKVLSMATPK